MNTAPVQKRKNHVTLSILLAALLLCMGFIIAIGIGRYHVPPIDVIRILFGDTSGISSSAITVVMIVRLPRLIVNILVGAALAVSGAVYQSMFKNPLVSSDILGVSSGASVGAAVAILMGLGGTFIQLFAFVSGILAVALVMLISRIFASRSSLVLVLAGIIVSGFMTSVLSLIKFTADTYTKLPEIVFWLMGSMASVKYADIGTYAPAIIACLLILFLAGWRLNIASQGDAEAKSLGMDIKKVRILFIICATVLTACSVSICGVIGWFSLVVPHLGRLIVGNNNKHLLIFSALLGGLIMIIIDTTARALIGGEIPLGILTGIMGTPVFAFILFRKRKTLRDA